jgi:pimeloyl-ACP methyl ester carboxylesterase
MAEDIAAFTRALGLGKVLVVGHSMGGVNGWWFAARHPERAARLVIIDIEPAALSADEVVRGWKAALDTYARSAYDGVEDAVEEYLADYTGTHHREQREFVSNNLKRGADGRWVWRFDARGLVSWMEHASAIDEEHWSAIKKLACPTLVIRAGDSPLTDQTGMKRLAREIPRSRYVEIPGAGHDIHIDQPDALVTELRRFFSRED